MRDYITIFRNDKGKAEILGMRGTVHSVQKLMNDANGALLIQIEAHGKAMQAKERKEVRGDVAGVDDGAGVSEKTESP